MTQQFSYKKGLFDCRAQIPVDISVKENIIKHLVRENKDKKNITEKPFKE